MCSGILNSTRQTLKNKIILKDNHGGILPNKKKYLKQMQPTSRCTYYRCECVSYQYEIQRYSHIQGCFRGQVNIVEYLVY